MHVRLRAGLLREGGREGGVGGGWWGGSKGGREGGVEGGREGWREGGMDGGRDREGEEAWGLIKLCDVACGVDEQGLELLVLYVVLHLVRHPLAHFVVVTLLRPVRPVIPAVRRLWGDVHVWPLLPLRHHHSGAWRIRVLGLGFGVRRCVSCGLRGAAWA